MMSSAVVTCHVDGTVGFWSATGAAKSKFMIKDMLSEHKGEIYDAALGGGNMLITAGQDGTLKICDVRRRICRGTLEGHQKGVRAVAAQADKAISAGGDMQICIWDVTNQSCEHTLNGKSKKNKGHTAEITCLQFGIENNEIISGSLDCSIRVWDTATKKVLRTMKMTNGCTCMRVVEEGAPMIISAGKDGGIYAFHYASSDEIHRFLAHDGGVYALDVQGGRIASGGEDMQVKLWSLEDMQSCKSSLRPKLTMKGHKNIVYSVVLTKRELFSGSWDDTIRIWDIKTGTVSNVLKTQAGVRSVLVLDSPWENSSQADLSPVCQSSPSPQSVSSESGKGESISELVQDTRERRKSSHDVLVDAMLDRYVVFAVIFFVLGHNN